MSLLEHTFEFKTKISSLDNVYGLETQRKNNLETQKKTKYGQRKKHGLGSMNNSLANV